MSEQLVHWIWSSREARRHPGSSRSEAVTVVADRRLKNPRVPSCSIRQSVHIWRGAGGVSSMPEFGTTIADRWRRSGSRGQSLVMLCSLLMTQALAPPIEVRAEPAATAGSVSRQADFDGDGDADLAMSVEHEPDLRSTCWSTPAHRTGSRWSGPYRLRVRERS